MTDRMAHPSTPEPAGPRHRWWTRLRRLGVPPKRIVVWSMVSSGPIAAVVLAGAVLSYHGHELLVESRLRVDHGYQVLTGLNKLFVALEDAETGQRGFIITGREDYLEPYVAALRQTDGHLARLRSLLASDPSQVARLSRLEQLMEAKLNELGSVIAVRRSEGFQPASDAILEGRGKQLMDGVRAEVAAIGEREETQLRAQQEDARQRERDILHTGATIAAVSIVVRFGLAFLLARLRNRRSQGA
jgi:methyl-accepting chemotaxis protein